MLILLSLLIAAPSYPWLADFKNPPETLPLSQRFSPPEGFQRVEVSEGSYAAWLRELPVRRDREYVLSYRGDRLIRPSAAIVLLDLGKRDLQQCADTIIRLHAEYLWSKKRYAQIAYHFTSGDRSAWSDWQRGERFKIKGRKVERVWRKGTRHNHRAFRRWLVNIFRFAGTQSLRFDSKRLGKRAFQAGDFFVQPGGPGHAVVILEIAEDQAGRRAALIGQGFMPAEDLHILSSIGPRILEGVWFLLPDEEHDSILTPSWSPFRRKEARRFKGRL